MSAQMFVKCLMMNWQLIKMDKRTVTFCHLLLGQFGANCSAFAQFEQQSINAFYNSSQQFCSEYNSLCYNNGSTTFTKCQNCTTNSNYYQLTQTTEIINFAMCPNMYCTTPCIVGTCSAGNVTIVNCVNECYTTQEMNTASQAVQFAYYHEIIKALISTIQPYLGCAFIVVFIESVYQPACNEFLYGLELLIFGSVLA